MGWVFFWLSLLWLILGIIKSFVRPKSDHQQSNSGGSYQKLNQGEHDIGRLSGDSGLGLEPSSSSLFGSGSPLAEQESLSFHDELPPYSRGLIDDALEKTGLLRGSKVEQLLSRQIQGFAARSVLVLNGCHRIIERTIILQGFAVIATGIVTFGGIFRGSQVFTGLAHLIKGGIFFWIGILTVARWAGAFADLGWAWNVKPTAQMVGRKAARAPSAEFFESLLISVYGALNVWLEHLAAWGGEWSAMDYEHLSITILFFGAGLLGMLVESKWVRRLLITGISFREGNVGAEKPNQMAILERSTTSMNPVPALTILLLGLIMAAHVQHSALAGTMHSYWGALFAFSAAARMGTYILHYLRPPVSHLPSRPPTELLAGFLLVSGGLLFMMSARDITDVIEGSGGDAMVAFVVCMGLTSVVCAGVVGCMAIKGWAVTKENTQMMLHAKHPKSAV